MQKQQTSGEWDTSFFVKADGITRIDRDSMLEEAVSALILNMLHINLKFTFLRIFLLQ